MESSERLDYRELASYKSLFLDYIYRFDRLSPFFAGNPQSPDDWVRAAQQLDPFSGDRNRVAQALRSLNGYLGADSEAMASIDALEKDALAVVTGQQVGVFGGPLYTLYKALTAAEIARRASSMLGRPVVPLFWMDAEDHDFEEVRHVRLLDSSHELLTLSYRPSQPDSRIPVVQYRVEPVIEEMFEQAARALTASAFKAEVLDTLRQCYRVGESLCAAFGRLLLRMTRGTGLAVVDPASPELKALAAPLFERESQERSESGRIVQRTTDRLVSLGYHAQAGVTPDQLNLFYAAPGRFHVTAEDSGFRIAADGGVLSPEELAKLIRREPDRFSPNVLLRPLYQDTVLPTLCYVSGPNELAYFAQLIDVYRHFGLAMPLISPRASFTIIEKAHKRFIERHRLDLSKLRANDESLLNRILREQAPPELEKNLSKAKSCIQQITETLQRDLSSVDPTLVSTVRTTRGKLLHHLDKLEAKSLRAIKRKDDTLRRQFLATRTALFPAFDMQERQLSPVQFLVKYGWYFSELVRQHIDPGDTSHVLIYP